MRAAIYARYSSSGQKPTSVDDQIALCQGAAARFGCVAGNLHIYKDAGVSGATDQRPGYQALMAAAKGRHFDAILVEAQDRLWRDQAEMHSALKRLRHWGVRVFSVEASADLTDKRGGIVAAVQGWQAEAFLDGLREKTRRGMLGQFERGFSAGGCAYGYRSRPIQDGGRKDPYGKPLVTGYRRVIDKAEARVVIRIFKMYASGLSPKTIAYQLNHEGVAPPRPKRNRRAQGWTPTTIGGSRKKAIGILNNPIYIGQVIWNRSTKVRDPETGRRLMRPRPRDEWVHRDLPELRIVPQPLWDQVKARQVQVQGQLGGQRGGPRNLRHMFSGLLRCGVCGAHYTMRDQHWMACAFHRNRGPSVCANSRVVRRKAVEARLLQAIEQEILSPSAIAYLTRKVNEAIAKAESQERSARRGLETELSKAEREVENIKEAVRLGKATIPLLEMLEEANVKAHRLRAELEAEHPKPGKAVVRALPALVEKYARDLRSVLGHDVERARLMLARLLGDITLRPEKDGLYAEMRGDLRVLLDGVNSGTSIGAGRGI